MQRGFKRYMARSSDEPEPELEIGPIVGHRGTQTQRLPVLFPCQILTVSALVRDAVVYIVWRLGTARSYWGRFGRGFVACFVALSIRCSVTEFAASVPLKEPLCCALPLTLILQKPPSIVALIRSDGSCGCDHGTGSMACGSTTRSSTVRCRLADDVVSMGDCASHTRVSAHPRGRSVPLHHPGVVLEDDEEAEEVTQVGALLFSGGKVGRLLETTPADAHVIVFDELFPKGMPAVETLVEKVQHWDIFAGPTTFTHRVLQGLPHIVRIATSESHAADDEGYHSSGQMDMPAAIEHVQGISSLLVTSQQTVSQGGRTGVPETPLTTVLRGGAGSMPITSPVHLAGDGWSAWFATSATKCKTKGRGCSHTDPDAVAAKRDPPDVWGGIRGRMGNLEATVQSLGGAAPPPPKAGAPSLLAPLAQTGVNAAAKHLAASPAVLGGGHAAYQAMLADAQVAGPQSRPRLLDQNIRDAVLGGDPTSNAVGNPGSAHLQEMAAAVQQVKDRCTLQEALCCVEQEKGLEGSDGPLEIQGITDFRKEEESRRTPAPSRSSGCSKPSGAGSSRAEVIGGSGLPTSHVVMSDLGEPYRQLRDDELKHLLVEGCSQQCIPVNAVRTNIGGKSRSMLLGLYTRRGLGISRATLQQRSTYRLWL
eukprot:5654685-Amphidinium_carterae.1